MPPRVRLSPDEAARLPGLLRFQPARPEAFTRCRSATDRVLWVLAAYGEADGRPLSAGLIPLLIFERGLTLSPARVLEALTAAGAAGQAAEREGGWRISQAGRARLAGLTAKPR